MIIQPLKVARAENNISQKELANIADVSEVTLSRIENGKARPHKETRKKIEEVLGEVDWQRTFSDGVMRQAVK